MNWQYLPLRGLALLWLVTASWQILSSPEDATACAAISAACYLWALGYREPPQ